MKNVVMYEKENSTKHVLILCNTYYQIMFAIQLKEFIFPNDSVDIGITDQTKGSLRIVNNFYKINVFHNCYYIECKELEESKTRKMKIQKLSSALFHNSEFELLFKNKNYDNLLYFNSSYSTVAIFNILVHNNSKLLCSRFEEGILSYNTELHERGNHSFGRFLDTLFKIRHFLGKPNIIDNIGNFYCFYPELYKLNFTPVEVPQFSNNSINIITKVFDVKKENCYINEKYIFFSSVYDFEGEEPIGEFEIIKKIANIVGIDNLIIKKHPRDNRDVFEKAGIHVAKVSNLPWEVCQLCCDYSNHILISISSGSLLTINSSIENPITSYYLFPCCHYQKNSIAKISVNAIENLFNNPNMKMKLRNIKIVSDIKDIFENNG